MDSLEINGRTHHWLVVGKKIHIPDNTVRVGPTSIYFWSEFISPANVVS